MRIIRILRAVGLSALALLLVAFAFVQIEQRLLRHRAERLLADFRSIRLHQSTWADAQVLMTRWGAWGHYDGQCTASDCAYTIMLADPISRISNHIKSDTGWRLIHRAAQFYEFFGGKPGWLTVSFLVQDGVIWRSSVGLLLDVPPHTYEKDDDYGYSLILSARASDSLRRKPDGPSVLGSDDQLADHPNYKAGRPGGCEICLMAKVTFTPYISSSELKEITSYNLSCLTNFHYCLNLPDVLPIARDWHLYPTMEPAYKEPSPPTTPTPCAIPVFARARDATSILLVDAISSATTKEKSGDDLSDRRDIQTAKIRLLQTLKGISPFAPGESFNAVSWPGGDINFPWKAREQFESGKRYVIFLSPDRSLSPVSLDFCGLIESTPSALAQVSQGIAQNDVLRRPEEFGGRFW
jgi:hypothetical protein